jgi:TonB family protein
VPDKLTREQVQSGMNGVSGAVKKCGQGQTGTVTVQVMVAPTGRVTSATTTGSFAGTPAGLCAARAVRGARFPQAKNSLTVTYPFKF